MDKRKGSPCQQGYLESSQAGKMMRYSIPNLPEDIWRHIHSLVPLRDAACASCVSRAFLHSWRCRPNLIFNRHTLRSKAHVSGANLSHTLDCILRRHSGVGVKTLQLVLKDIANNGDLDSWLQVAAAPGIEELILMPISEMIKYNFLCSHLLEGVRNSIRLLTLGYCAFRPTPELGPLRSLTSLCLDTVGITGYDLECFFSHSRALERLVLMDCQEIICLKIPCELQQLSSLRVCGCWRLKVIESKAPNLSNLAIIGKDVHTPMLPTKFMYLKQLTISITSGLTFSPSYDYFSVVSFLDASPSLEILVLDVSQQRMGHASVFEDSSSLRQIDESNYCCHKTQECEDLRVYRCKKLG
ncbi:hypothetical protein PVAP13_4KG383403 [Panicum virgatum]|nr:hypothetical protein PVAP13_4KG383403 [Panicum virgatum]